MNEEWYVYSFTDPKGKHRVSCCPRSMWVKEWEKDPDYLRQSNVALLSLGLSADEAKRYVKLATEE